MKYAFTYHLLPCLNFVIHKSSGCQQTWQTEGVARNLGLTFVRITTIF